MIRIGNKVISNYKAKSYGMIGEGRTELDVENYLVVSLKPAKKLTSNQQGGVEWALLLNLKY